MNAVKCILTRRLRGLSVLAFACAPMMTGCDRRPARRNDVSTRSQHPHTIAVLKMIEAMELAGYHPAQREKMNKTFQQDPIAWLGPWQIAVPDGDGMQVEWRLTIYIRNVDTQYHSFVSVQEDRRLCNGLIARLRDEWDKMAPVGLPDDTVAVGRQLIQDATTALASHRSERSSTETFGNEVSARSEKYEFRLQLYDRIGFTDEEGTVADFGRAILLFTRVDAD